MKNEQLETVFLIIRDTDFLKTVSRILSYKMIADPRNVTLGVHDPHLDRSPQEESSLWGTHILVVISCSN